MKALVLLYPLSNCLYHHLSKSVEKSNKSHIWPGLHFIICRCSSIILVSYRLPISAFFSSFSKKKKTDQTACCLFLHQLWLHLHYFAHICIDTWVKSTYRCYLIILFIPLACISTSLKWCKNFTLGESLNCFQHVILKFD